MKYFCNLLSILFVLNTNFAQSNLTADKSVLEGLDDVYNLRFDEAADKFTDLQKTTPNDLKGYFYESLLYFYKALPTRDEKMFDKYLDLSENVIERAEINLEKNENDYDALYYKGLSHSYRSLLMLSLNKNLLKAASDGNSGYRILTALIEKKPDYYDAYMGLGLYKIAIGFVPEKFQWLLSLIGFKGNIKEGMQYLQTSMQKGKFTRVDSKVFLSMFSLKEKEEQDNKALIYAKEVSEEYKSSAVFKILYSGLLLQYGFAEDAISTANEALNINNNSFQDEIKKSAGAIIGSAYFRLNDYKKAIPNFEQFIKYANPEDRYNVYLFTLGVSYELTGDRSKAMEKYKAVRDNFINERDGELDKFFYRLAQEKIKMPLRNFDIKLIKGMNLRESNQPVKAIELYTEMINTDVVNKNISDDDIIRLYFDLGVAYSYNKDSDNAIETFNKCIKLKPANEEWLVPHSYFELGKLYRQKGDISKSNEMFDMIFDYDDFDFESFLEMRLANYLNK